MWDVSFKENATKTSYKRFEFLTRFVLECCYAHFTYHLRFRVSISGTTSSEGLLRINWFFLYKSSVRYIKLRTIFVNRFSRFSIIESMSDIISFCKEDIKNISSKVFSIILLFLWKSSLLACVVGRVTQNIVEMILW